MTLPLFPDLPEGKPDDLARCRAALEAMDRLTDDLGSGFRGRVERAVVPLLTGGLGPLLARYTEMAAADPLADALYAEFVLWDGVRIELARLEQARYAPSIEDSTTTEDE